MTKHTAPDGSATIRFTATERVVGLTLALSLIGILSTIGLTSYAEAKEQTKALIEIRIEVKHIGDTVGDHEARIRTLEHGGD